MTNQKASEALKQYFGYDFFRPMQAEIIESVLQKKDTVVLMPTGGGKSVCFQIPGIIMPGMCVVVSPLISLMHDQVVGLRANGVKAAYLNSSLTAKQMSHVENLVTHKEIDLLYVSPEKMLSEQFLNFISHEEINLFAIDEAHCISQWGHDFRPEYTQMKMLKERFPNIPVIAMTATADKPTRRDIVEQMGMNDPQVFVASFDRPNLSLSVLPARNRYKVILDFIRQRNGQSGIVYCLSRKNTEDLSAKLKAQGIPAACYHAGMESAQRKIVQEAFINDRVKIICATIAFGMGIDKPDVRWIIHHNLPKNIESYYQEIGRAGRDSLPSDTLLFFSYGDVVILRQFMEESGQKELQLAKLQSMINYAEAVVCRRRILLNYFSDNYDKDCGNCDVCKNPPSHFDGTVVAQKALSAIMRTGQKIGIGLLIDILRGSSRRQIFQGGFHEIKTYGAGKDLSYDTWQQYILQMIQLGLVEIAYDQFSQLKVTEAGKAVLFEGKKVDMVTMETVQKKTEERVAKRKSKSQMVNDELFERLRDLRWKLAQQKNIPAYQVFNDATLEHMTKEKPVTGNEMRNISGVGELKFKEYGDLFISEIMAFLQEKGKEGTKIRGGTYKITFEAYQRGLTPYEIARERQLNPETIFTHLAKLYTDGYDVDILQYIQKDNLQTIIDAIKALGGEVAPKAIFEYLQEKVEYFEIRLVLAYLQKGGANAVL